MASITSRIAGWTAGRLKGEKARKRTMDWMQKTGVGQLLGVAGDAALIGGALKGAGAIKGGLKELLGIKAGTGTAALPSTPIESARGMLAGGDADLVAQAVEGGRAMTPPLKPMGAMGGTSTAVAPRVSAAPSMTPPPTPTTPRPNLSALRLGDVANANVVTQPRMDMSKMLGRAGGAVSSAGRFARENVEPLAYGASALTDYFANRRRTDLEEEQLRLEQERRNRLAELLMPMFQAEVQRYGQSNRG